MGSAKKISIEKNFSEKSCLLKCVFFFFTFQNFLGHFFDFLKLKNTSYGINLYTKKDF